MSYIEDLFGVAGKSVLVTGGSRGIGQAIAEGFVKAGARVYICSRDVDACQAAAEALRADGDCVGLPQDLATAEGRAALVAELGRHEASLDVLVNNAGAIWAAPFADYPEAGWDKVFDLNVKSCFFLTQALLPLLEKAATPEDPARVINVGSINGIKMPAHETYAYVASKAALHRMTLQMAGHLAKRAITVNVLAPGIYPSKMQVKQIERLGLDTLTAPIPLGRLAAPSDMAAAALYLASAAGAYLTGIIVPVDGGLTAT